MGSVFKPISFILNILITVLGFAIACVSAWLFIEVKEIVNLRNSDRYLLNFQLHWPQIVPWMFLIVGVLLILVSLCGMCGSCKSSRSILVTYIIFVSVAIVACVVASITALAFADNKNTDKFLSEALYDVSFQMRDHKHVAKAFGKIEERLRCCGAGGPRDYTSWMTKFPESCCEINSLESCDFGNSLPHDRHGCIEVASQYAKIFIKTLSAAAIFSGLLCILNLIVSLMLTKSLRGEPRTMVDKHESEKLKMPI